MPRLAIISKTQEQFFKELDSMLEVAEEGLVYKAKRTFEATPDMAPILFKEGAFGRLKDDEEVSSLYLNDRATVSLGYIGLYEVASRFFGENWETNPVAKKFTVDILKEIKKATDNWSEKYDVHFSPYGTPAESLTDRFCKLDSEKYGHEITKKGYYTNSYHYDVRKDVDPFTKIDFEAEYPQYAPGGFIH